ncbi:unnamed protein product [Lampetra fluviatilis]
MAAMAARAEGLGHLRVSPRPAPPRAISAQRTRVSPTWSPGAAAAKPLRLGWRRFDAQTQRMATRLSPGHSATLAASD